MMSVTDNKTGSKLDFDENEIVRDFEFYLNDTIKNQLKEKGLNYMLQKIDDYITDCVFYDIRPFRNYQEAQFGVGLALVSKLIEIQKGGN